MSYQLLPLNETDDIAPELDVTVHEPGIIKRAGAKHRLVFFVFIAALSGIIWPIIGFIERAAFTNVSSPDDMAWPSSPSPRPYLRPGLGQYVVPGEEEWSMDRIQEMVSKTKGYYARNYTLSLGWNNVSSCHRHNLGLSLTLRCRCDTLLKHPCYMLSY